MPQRNVTITPQQDQFVKSVLESGQYGNVSEVFRAGLRLLEHEEQARIIECEIIRQNIEKGINDIKAGNFTEIETEHDLNKYFENKRKQRQEWIEKQPK